MLVKMTEHLSVNCSMLFVLPVANLAKYLLNPEMIVRYIAATVFKIGDNFMMVRPSGRIFYARFFVEPFLIKSLSIK